MEFAALYTLSFFHSCIASGKKKIIIIAHFNLYCQPAEKKLKKGSGKLLLTSVCPVIIIIEKSSSIENIKIIPNEANNLHSEYTHLRGQSFSARKVASVLTSLRNT